MPEHNPRGRPANYSVLPRQLKRKFTGVEHLANKIDSEEDINTCCQKKAQLSESLSPTTSDLKPSPLEINLETTDKKHEEILSLSKLTTPLTPEASSPKLSTPERARSKKIKKNSPSKTQHKFEKIECKNIENMTRRNKSLTQDKKSSAQENKPLAQENKPLAQENRSSTRCKNGLTHKSNNNRGRITHSMTRAAEKKRRETLKKSIISHLKALESSHSDTEDSQISRTDAAKVENLKRKRQESDDIDFYIPRSKVLRALLALLEQTNDGNNDEDSIASVVEGLQGIKGK
ncbi:hypothetical protein K3495_g4820 [Podosphaera aphanis]|nr:hypothetical protein K3495_g4820 [Podosphaera aphanis]